MKFPTYIVSVVLYALLFAVSNNANATYKAISAGSNHTCALSTYGTVKCWGSNASGELGSGIANYFPKIPVAVRGLTGVRAISVGDGHTCALTFEGSVKCWGRNDSGELGNGTNNNGVNAPVSVIGLSGIKMISSGGSHTCALTTLGKVKCWGNNSDGQLGFVTSSYFSNTPKTVSGLSDVTAISAGGEHTCALIAEGTVKCWGSNAFGQLGDGINDHGFARYESFPFNDYYDPSITPVTVINLGNVIAISSGYDHTCALDASGIVKCWGSNYFGQLGDGTEVRTVYNVNTPVTVSYLNDVKAISAGEYQTCALTSNGIVKCWGSVYVGRMDDVNGYYATTPVVVGMSAVKAIEVGNQYACALTTALTVICRGSNFTSQLGDGTNLYSNTPVMVQKLNESLKVYSSAAQDGWLLESAENSNRGGKIDSVTSSLIVGDNAKNQQYRSLLHFDTAGLPDNSVITKVTLTLKKQGIYGDVKSLGDILVDMRQKYFGSNAGLEKKDFEASAGSISVGTINDRGSIYTITLIGSNVARISKTGVTQFKLHFAKDDNNDKSDDYLKFYSGDAYPKYKPYLEVEYK